MTASFEHAGVGAVDCELVVNPVTVPGPIHGAIIFRITAALYDAEISLKDGLVEQTRFNTSNSPASIRRPIIRCTSPKYRTAGRDGQGR